MRLTIPQVIMLNHAAYVNQKRAEAAAKAKSNEGAPVGGKRVGEMNSDEYARYFGGLGGTVNVVAAPEPPKPDA